MHLTIWGFERFRVCNGEPVHGPIYAIWEPSKPGILYQPSILLYLLLHGPRDPQPYNPYISPNLTSQKAPSQKALHSPVGYLRWVTYIRGCTQVLAALGLLRLRGNAIGFHLILLVHVNALLRELHSRKALRVRGLLKKDVRGFV